MNLSALSLIFSTSLKQMIIMNKRYYYILSLIIRSVGQDTPISQHLRYWKEMFLIKLTPKSLEKSLPSLCLNVPISREPIQVLIEKNEKILFDFQARCDFLQWLSTQNKVHEHLLLSCYFLFNLCKVLPLSLQDSRPKERHQRWLWSCQALPKCFIPMGSGFKFEAFPDIFSP